MLRVAGRPILERIVLHLVGHGLTRIYLAVDYLGGRDRGALRRREPARLPDRVPARGATAGHGGRARPPARGTDRARVLVMNGDLVTQADLGALLDATSRPVPWRRSACAGTCTPCPSAASSATATGVTALEEKPTVVREVNAGIYVLEPDRSSARASGTCRPNDCPTCSATPSTEASRVGAFEIEDDWIDVGQRDQLAHAREGEA